MTVKRFLRLSCATLLFTIGNLPALCQPPDTVKAPFRISDSSETRQDKGAALRYGDVDIGVVFGTYFQFYPIDNHVSAPDYLLSQPHRDSVIAQRWGLKNEVVTDNPLFHGAASIDLALRWRPIAGVTLRASLNAEHRGGSFGVYDTRNMIVYPTYDITVDTTATLFGLDIRGHLSLGNRRDTRLYEGLMIYNMDVQRTELFAQYKRVRFTYHKIMDLLAGIGLGIDDANDWMVSLEEVPIAGAWKADIRGGAFNYPYLGYTDDFFTRMFFGFQPTVYSDGYTASVGVYNDKIRAYAQGATRNPGQSQSFMRRSAFVGGIAWNSVFGPLSLAGRAEGRSYGSEFNSDFYYPFVYYRDTARAQSMNTIGDHLYPLRGFDRPFSQWAVFTEYVGRNVAAYALQFDAKLRIDNAITLRAALDLNAVKAEGESLFLYPFYDVGVGWEPVAGISLAWSYTNRGMNLDKHYPTLYLYRQPVTSIMIRVAYPEHAGM